MGESGPKDALGPLSSAPRDYRAEAAPLDGRPVVLRAIRPEDEDGLLEVFEHAGYPMLRRLEGNALRVVLKIAEDESSQGLGSESAAE